MRRFLCVVALAALAACAARPPAKPEPSAPPLGNAPHLVALGAQTDDAASAPALAVTGTLARGVLRVDPVYEIRTDTATDDGPDRIAGYDRSGKRLFLTHFGVAKSERHFVAFVPLTQPQIDRLAMLRVDIGSATALVTGTGASEPQAYVYRERRGVIAFSRNSRAFPEATIAEPVKGGVLGLGVFKNGAGTWDSSEKSLTIEFSNGLRSFRRTFPVR